MFNISFYNYALCYSPFLHHQSCLWLLAAKCTKLSTTFRMLVRAKMAPLGKQKGFWIKLPSDIVRVIRF